ncbi:hypothetical protein OESDEN_01797 [Oesophagostomum dentatum]|uniref:Uncharacterized protein n=1 Tax=Oesophagostomum dentatum TaxID=61180 RepID=A0A0B1TQ56_OESDE|nr:hypothetical protein OESDEN_01797 [Oesophagostomum dentatum]
MKQPKFSGSMIYLRSAKLFENIHVWLFITGLSTVFISINSMMMLCMLWIKFKPNDVLITIIFMLPGLLSLLGPLTIFSMHKKIRQQFLTLMGFRHSASLEPKLQIRQNQSRIEVIVATQADHNTTFRLNPEKVDYGVMKRYRFLHCPYLI